MRPVVKPALARLWRDRETLQLGLDPRHSLVLTGLDAPVVDLLDRLDGTRDRPALLASAEDAGIDRARAELLLNLLAAGGVLDDASSDPRPVAGLDAGERDRLSPDIAALSLASPEPGRGLEVLGARRRAVVEVVGAGRVGAPLGAHLAAAGIGHVLVSDDGTATMADVAVGGLARGDTGRPRRAAARAAMRRVSTPDSEPAPVGRRPDLVVFAPVGAAPVGAAQRLVDEGTAHLMVRVSETCGVVGPLVLPGRTSCLTCADLHRTGRDPAWPLLLAQLSSPGPGACPAVDGTLAAAVAAHAALQALHLLEFRLRPGSQAGPPATTNGTLELVRSDWRWRRRSWPAHPRCHCRAASWAPPAGD